MVLDVRDAMRCALERAQPGDVVVVGCASHLSDLKSALEGGDPVFSVDAAGLRTLSASDAAVEMPEEEELRV